MNEKENHIIYSAQDIEQYLGGKLSPLQMHAMEKAALDDPFLAEALEGYEAADVNTWKEQLAAAKKQFEKQEHQAKVIALPVPRKNNWWKAAAAVVVIGITATLSYLLLNKKEGGEIAQTVKQETGTVTPPANDNNTTAVTSTATTPASDSFTNAGPSTSKAVTDKAATANTASTIKADNSIADRQAETAPVTNKIADDNIAKNNGVPPASAAPAAVYNNAVKEKEAVVQNSKPVAAQYDNNQKTADVKKEELKDKNTPALNLNFTAQVVGPDNTPLPYANISIKNENFGTYADVKGNFRLVSSDSLLTVEVKAAGYQPKQYTLQSSSQQNKIVMAEEDAAARYKAVVGNNTAAAKTKASRKATLLKDSLVNVEPADGWDNYNTYVDNNIEIPDDIFKKGIHGRVELSFDVQSNGTITNIKVDKSLCDNCDEAAKRLIEQGPQWKVKKGKKGKGKVIVQF